MNIKSMNIKSMNIKSMHIKRVAEDGGCVFSPRCSVELLLKLHVALALTGCVSTAPPRTVAEVP